VPADLQKARNCGGRSEHQAAATIGAITAKEKGLETTNKFHCDPNGTRLTWVEV
jgi:hypothetical protein